MSATSRYYRPPTETKRTKTYEELFGVPESAERIAYDKEQARLEEQARKERQEADRKRREAYFAEQEKIKSDTLVAEGKEIVGSYRDQYSTEQLFELGAVNSFEIAKVVADETYKQYWYDKANDIIGNFTDEDYKLIAEPQYETYRVGKGAGDFGGGVERTRRVLPEGYKELQEINAYIEKGPLDFSDKETHLMLIKSPQNKRGYGKYQKWIDESDPLRQAVEAQADVMTKYLDNEGISIVKDFEDGNPNNIYGEGVYLNTGTAAHIDWDSELKRGQSYRSAPDAELGSYSQVFYRPEKESILDHWMVDIMAAVTGTSDLLAAGRGGDIGDILEGAVIGSVAPDFLETGLGKLGIDADLFGIDPDTFSNSINEVQTAGLEGDSMTDALLKEFGGAATENLAGVIGDAAGGVLGGAVDLLDDTFDYIGDTALVGAVEAGGKALGGAIESGVGVVSDITSDFEDVVRETGSAIDDTLIQPVLGAVEPVIKTIEAGGRAIDKNITQPTIKAIGEGIDTISDITSEAEDIVRAGGSAVDDTLIQPTIKVVEEGAEAISNVTSEVEDIVRAGGRAVDENILQPTIKTIDELVRKIPEPPEIDIDLPELNVDLPDLPDFEFPEIDIDLPELNVDLPEFNAPDIDLPEIDIDLPSIDVELPELSFDPKLLAGLMPTPQQPTQVEGLFDKELFKFDTEIKSTQEMLSPLMNLRRYG
jgi:hypothetical protein